MTEDNPRLTFDTLDLEVRDQVAHIRLNRPEAANSVNLGLAKDLMHAVLQCTEDREVRAVLITGNGSAFCTGGDIKEFAAAGPALSYRLKELTTYFHAAVSRLVRMDRPVIAAVNGAAAGAGMSLALACDIVVAAESARFTMAYTRIGLTPDGASTYFLSRIVGLRRAQELILTNRVLSAHEAMDWHITTQVVPDAELMNCAGSLAARLASGPTRALGQAKQLVYRGWMETLETQMESESQSIAEMGRTQDAHEGIHSFLAKRPPTFRGE